MIWLLQTALADCTTPGSPDRIQASILAAEQAFDAMEVDAVLSHTDAVLKELSCLDAPVSPELMIAVHRAMGLRAKVEDHGDASRAKRAFAASRQLDPERPLPQHIATGPEFDIWRDFHAIPLQERAEQPLLTPRSGTVYVDGEATDTSAERWPMLFQYEDRKGNLTSTYAWPDDPLPKYPVKNPNTGPVTLGLASLALAGAGVGLMAYGWDGVQSTDNATTRSQYTARIYTGYALLGTAGGGLVIGNIWAMRNGQKMSTEDRR
jgi:hypothetical protein